LARRASYNECRLAFGQVCLREQFFGRDRLYRSRDDSGQWKAPTVQPQRLHTNPVHLNTDVDLPSSVFDAEVEPARTREQADHLRSAHAKSRSVTELRSLTLVIASPFQPLIIQHNLHFLF